MADKRYEILEAKEAVLADNDAVAAGTRVLLKEKGVFLVNLMSSPGSGKTTTLLRTIDALNDRYRIGVIEADVDSDVDATAVADAGAAVVQVHTGGSCHMDASMTLEGLKHLDLDDLDLVFLENVGNLVCPAEFDVGANRKVMILSVPEGDDKPLKYPLMFTVSDAMLINKIDVAPVFDFDYDSCEQRAKVLNPNLFTTRMSSLTGEGFDAWLQWLEKEICRWREEL
ncbi:MAG: hydrogenase nickel incorporation protein HypB [Oscillospiraceae bacterium]|nr:hydrogenase nickel incorporation protein HypB [Oscillospiraceae bacterium]